MQKWKVFEDRWHPVKDDEGRHYLVSEVDAALAEKDGQLDSLLAESIILARQKDELKEQIATLQHSLKIQRNERERLNKHIDKQDEQIERLKKRLTSLPTGGTL